MLKNDNFPKKTLQNIFRNKNIVQNRKKKNYVKYIIVKWGIYVFQGLPTKPTLEDNRFWIHNN